MRGRSSSSRCRASTGWKLSDIQFAFTLFILFQTWVQPLDGWLDRSARPARVHQRGGCCCAASAGPGMGYATSLPMLYALYCVGRHRRGVRLQRLDRIGAEVVQGAARARVRHHGGRVRRRHGAVHPGHLSR